MMTKPKRTSKMQLLSTTQLARVIGGLPPTTSTTTKSFEIKDFSLGVENPKVTLD